MEDNNDSKKNMQKSLEIAARTYKAAKELEQSALKMKRLADELFSQVEKTMVEFKDIGKDFLESYNEIKTPKELPPEIPSKEEGMVIKRKNTPAE